MTLQGEERRHLLESALEYFPVTREKVNVEPACSLVQAPALSADVSLRLKLNCSDLQELILVLLSA